MWYSSAYSYPDATSTHAYFDVYVHARPAANGDRYTNADDCPAHSLCWLLNSSTRISARDWPISPKQAIMLVDQDTCLGLTIA